MLTAQYLKIDVRSRELVHVANPMVTTPSEQSPKTRKDCANASHEVRIQNDIYLGRGCMHTSLRVHRCNWPKVDGQLLDIEDDKLRSFISEAALTRTSMRWHMSGIPDNAICHYMACARTRQHVIPIRPVRLRNCVFASLYIIRISDIHTSEL